MISRLAPRDIGLACAAVALALDQGTKLLLLYGFHFIDDGPHRIQILPFFNLVMLWNPGISYGLFPARSTAGTALIAVFEMAAAVGLGWWMWRADRKILSAGLGLVIGGALGNLIDRLVYTRVADFFHFYVRGFDWYVFNIADCAIALGVAALLYDAVLRPEPQAGRSNG
ncbi:MAG: signal peptidase II [Rhizomicrobium sp.]|jgi:signal peptidase II